MNWLKFLVGLSAIIIAGCAAFFSVTGLGVLFAGASTSVMVMAGSLEFAKLVAATYLKQTWDDIRGFNKWYLTTAVATLMLITSAGIFGYLSNAFQQQNLQLQQVEREIAVHSTKIEQNNAQITQLSTQITESNTNQGKILDNGKVNSRLLRSVDNRDRQIAKLNDKISKLQDANAKENDEINKIKTNNLDLEKEVGGFRFVADAFGLDLNTVVKFFIFIIVIVFDPLAVALIIAFNGLIMKRKEEDDISHWDTTLGDGLDDLMEKNYQIYGDNRKNYPTQEERHDLLTKMMENDQELGLYDEPILASEADAKTFVEALETPPPPNEELIEAATQYDEEVKKNSEPILEEFIEQMDTDLLNLKQDFSKRGIDVDGDGDIDGWDTNGDGVIDIMQPSSSARWRYVENEQPYYARNGFDWSDKSKWINDQNAVNYWINFVKSNKYPTNFESKSY